MFNHAIKFEEDFITRGLEVRAHFHEFWMSDMYGDSPAFLSEKRGPELFNVAIAFTVLETIFVILYFSSRVMSKTANGWDVRLILPAYLSNIGLIGCVSSKSFLT